MTPEMLIQNAIAPALRLLGPKMDSNEAIAMMLAIAMQESRIKNRKQIGGPARGYWQFELVGGIKGVMTHPASRDYARATLTALDYDPNADLVAFWSAAEHNDILAASFARLLLWTLPETLPTERQPDEAWRQYLKAWRPGKPHQETWEEHYKTAWNLALQA